MSVTLNTRLKMSEGSSTTDRCLENANKLCKICAHVAKIAFAVLAAVVVGLIVATVSVIAWPIALPLGVLTLFGGAMMYYSFNDRPPIDLDIYPSDFMKCGFVSIILPVIAPVAAGVVVYRAVAGKH